MDREWIPTRQFDGCFCSAFVIIVIIHHLLPAQLCMGVRFVWRRQKEASGSGQNVFVTHFESIFLSNAFAAPLLFCFSAVWGTWRLVLIKASKVTWRWCGVRLRSPQQENNATWMTVRMTMMRMTFYSAPQRAAQVFNILKLFLDECNSFFRPFVREAFSVVWIKQ